MCCDEERRVSSNAINYVQANEEKQKSHVLVTVIVNSFFFVCMRRLKENIVCESNQQINSESKNHFFITIVLMHYFQGRLFLSMSACSVT